MTTVAYYISMPVLPSANGYCTEVGVEISKFTLKPRQASNETKEGRADDRRVEVKVLVNKGIVGS